jgi:diacylglycerol kinase
VAKESKLPVKGQQGIARSFDHAYRGLVYAVRTQRNMRFHVVAAAVVLVGSLFLGVSKLELAVLVLVIMFVFVTEMFNTALEFAVDPSPRSTTRWRSSRRTSLRGPSSSPASGRFWWGT